MKLIDSATILSMASMSQIVSCLKQAFREEFTVPSRQIASVPGGDGNRLFVSMPAFDATGAAAIKLATVFPDNPSKRLPSIQALIIVFSAAGTPVAALDGTLITRLRTGAASALASTYLSRPDSKHLLIIGTGALAPFMALAHAALRPIQRISVWGRRPQRATATSAFIQAALPALDVRQTDDLEHAIAAADIISCATSSSTPVLIGAHLRPGVFVDLVGSFSPSAREADDDAIKRSKLFVDTLSGAMQEAGDILHPLARGIITPTKIEGDLADLVSGRIAGRQTSEEITLFKSVGTALEDMAVAQMIVAAVEARRGTEV
jgi:alanine dehydrogenase